MEVGYTKETGYFQRKRPFAVLSIVISEVYQVALDMNACLITEIHQDVQELVNGGSGIPNSTPVS